MVALLTRVLGPYLLPVACAATFAAGIASAGTVAHFYNSWWHDGQVRKEALKGYVAEAKYDAVAAQLAKVERDRTIASNALDAYRRQADVDAVAEQEQTVTDAQSTATYEERRKAAGKFDPMMNDDWDFIEGKSK
jgi:hypothetical protein